MIRRALATYASSTTDADDLIQRYAPLIDRVARRIAARTGLRSAFDDLWSAGALGLLEAAPRFDAARGVSFETFVEHRIRGAMLDELRKMDHLPRRLRSRTDDVQKVKQKLAAQLGREATTEEVAQAMNVDLEELSGLEALLEPHVPLDKATHALASGEGHEPGVEEKIERAQLAKALAEGFKKLPERLQVVMGLHYVEGLTYREIAKMLDVSEPRVCQTPVVGA
jgi:RNA polymerase sigma factor for flagellar operon FliA